MTESGIQVWLLSTFSCSMNTRFCIALISRG